MAYELEQSGLNVERQQKIDVYYRGIVVGEYFADLVGSDKVIVDLIASPRLNQQYEANCLTIYVPPHTKLACS